MRLKNKSVFPSLPAFLLLTAVISLISVISTYAEIAIPSRPLNHVVDLAGIINSNMEASLNRYLLELEQKTTAQMVVLTIDSLEGEPIEDLSMKIAHEKWKLGQKDKDNGVLLLIALQDRKYRFEIGYGLEGTLPDSLVGSIGRDYLVPYFRKGDFSTGIFAASLAVISEISSDSGVEIAGMPKLKNRHTASPYSGGGRGKPTVIGAIFSVLFFIGIVYLAIRHPRLFMFLLVMSMMSGGRRSGWGGGGGFGGGSFGGGGGGGFGGGGASGGW